MPHQLRRVIAINIIAAKTGQPSGLISELDVRGKVLAVGINGVGKTTFLRTIPLFYGAVPKEILKGSHRGSMITYTLPTSSSAMVYEYERTSEDDLRCAVMYRRPNEDEAVFYIMRGGWDESFFVDENEEFVDAPTFKARAEAAGVWVSQALRMNQYRSVILREKPMTKDGPKLRELALEHSLGPNTLTNLGPISAAISTEKINFDDLRRIVVDRVSEDSGNAANDGMLAQKPIREELKRWMETRDHMATILSLKPKAEDLRKKARALHQRHMELCSLHVAVKKTIVQCQLRKEALAKQLIELQNEVGARIAVLTGEIKEIDLSLAETRKLHSELEIEIKAITLQKAHFDRILIQELIELDARKGGFTEELASVNGQLSQFNSSVTDARDRAKNRRTSIDQADSQMAIELANRTSTLQTRNKDSLEELRQDESRARSDLKPSKELKDLENQQLQVQLEKGRLENQIRSPQLTSETENALAEVDSQLEQAEEDHRARETQESSAKAVQEKTQKEADEASSEVTRINDAIERALENLSRLQSQLTPADGTLLAFIRSQDEAAWSDAARALDPVLLQRKDLEPDFEASGTSNIPGRVAVGPISISVRKIEEPGWVHESELKREIELQEAALSEMRRQLGDAKLLATSKGKALVEAKKALAGAGAQCALAKNAVNAARSQQRSVRETAKLERSNAAASAGDLLVELNEKFEALSDRIQFLGADFEAKVSSMEKEFADRRKAIEDLLLKGLKEIENDRTSHETSSEKQRSEIDADLKRELEGLGINAESIEKLESTKNGLIAKLERISNSQGELKSWQSFSTKVLPSLPEMQRRLASHAGAISKLLDDKKGKELVLEDYVKVVGKQAETLNDQIVAADGHATMLATLQKTSLMNFLDHVQISDTEEWHPETLRDMVTKALSSLSIESVQVQSDCRQLRNEMLRHENQIADWLRQKERDLPDQQVVLPHEYDRARAEIVCQWFEPSEHGQLLAQLNRQKVSFFMVASGFVDALSAFDANVESFNKRLRIALSNLPQFHSIGELEVSIRSGVSKLDYLKVLQAIKDRHRALSGTVVSLMADDRELPSAEDTNLIRSYRSILQSDGGYSINLREQVELEFSLKENNNRHKVRNAVEFAAISSNGLTALITSLFLMGFVQMIRHGGSIPAITWPSDEIGRLDSSNLASFLKILTESGINVVCAEPHANPAVAHMFDRISSFEDDGSVATASLEGEFA